MSEQISSDNNSQDTPNNNSSETNTPNSEQLFEQQLFKALCRKLILLGEIKNEDEFLESYPKDNLADVHNNETGAYYLMNRESPIKLVEYSLKSFEVFEV